MTQQLLELIHLLERCFPPFFFFFQVSLPFFDVISVLYPVFPRFSFWGGVGFFVRSSLVFFFLPVRSGFQSPLHLIVPPTLLRRLRGAFFSLQR